MAPENKDSAVGSGGDKSSVSSPTETRSRGPARFDSAVQENEFENENSTIRRNRPRAISTQGSQYGRAPG